MSEFRVDRPGRYRMRDGREVLVVPDPHPAFGYHWMTITTDEAMYFGNNGKYWPKEWTDNDLVAYLGPLEEECQDEPIDDVISGVAHRNMQEGYVERLQEADKELDAALAEIDRLKVEIDRLEKSRNHCKFCDAAIVAGKPVLPRIPLTTPAIERYTTPMLGTQR